MWTTIEWYILSAWGVLYLWHSLSGVLISWSRTGLLNNSNRFQIYCWHGFRLFRLIYTAPASSIKDRILFHKCWCSMLDANRAMSCAFCSMHTSHTHNTLHITHTTRMISSHARTPPHVHPLNVRMCSPKRRLNALCRPSSMVDHRRTDNQAWKICSAAAYATAIAAKMSYNMILNNSALVTRYMLPLSDAVAVRTRIV